MRTRLLLLCLATTLTSSAQVWAPPEATWHYSFSSGFGAMGFVRITVGNDTTVQGHMCKILEKRSIGHDFANGVDYDGSIGEEITFDSLGLVLIYDPLEENFDTLFNINAAPADTWTLPDRPVAAVCDPTSHAIVLDTGTRVIQGVPLKWIKVDVQFSPVDFADYSYTDTIFERIGPVDSYLLPHDRCNEALDGQQGGPFRCYQDGQLTYQRNTGSACEAPLSVHTHDHASMWLFPNPGTAGFTIQLGPSEVSTLCIFDAVGRHFLPCRTINGPTTVDASNWPFGVYQIVVLGSDGLRRSFRWVKQ